MEQDIEKQCLRFNQYVNDERATNEHSVKDAQDLMRLHQSNFALPGLSHLRLKQMALELNMPLYPVARAAVFLGIYYLRRDIQNPKLSQYLLEFLEEHRSLRRDRKGEVAQR